MGIADFRYNAFNNAMEPINITDEVHTVPTNAPHNIQLSEVPSKDNPSSLVVKYLDVRDGVELIEVGAPPGAGQFWCDYNTENPSWNTGTIRFNAADAGKAVKVNYKGTGTLAGVKSSRLIAWQNARGSGLLGDKVCSNGEVFQGTYQYRNFIVPAGVTVYIELSAVIMCTGSCTVLGAINGVGRGSGGIGAYGGSGGSGGNSNDPEEATGSPGANCTYAEQMFGYIGSPPGFAINILSYCDTAVFFGGAGGIGGYSRSPGNRGGAGIKVVATSFTNFGLIDLCGANGAGGWNVSTGKYSGGNGGGGGGGLFVAANKLSNKGTITVAGGAGGPNGGNRSQNGNPGYPGFIHLAEVMP